MVTLEGVDTEAIEPDGASLRVITGAGEFVTRSLVVVAGHGTNDVLSLLPGCGLRVPITKDRPTEAKYFVPPEDRRHQFTSDAMPVIAAVYLGVAESARSSTPGQGPGRRARRWG